MRSRRPASVLAAVGLVLAAVLAPAAPASGADRAADGPSANAGPASPALVTPVLSARRLPGLLAAPVADHDLSAAVTPILAQAPPTSCLVVTEDGRPIVDIKGDLPVMPASTEKLLTAISVLAHFGPTAKFQTSLLAAAPARGGVVDGDVFLVGGGDPLLQTAGFQPSQIIQGEPFNDFAKLADLVKAAGVTQITGGIVGDDSRYDAERYPASWPRRYIAQGQSGPISALSVNGGFTGLTADPEAPAADRQPGDPPSLAATTLVTLLRARGITVSGPASSGHAPTTAKSVVATLPSLPLSQILVEMLHRSDNTVAESLNKELGRALGGGGTTAAGTKAVDDTLRKLGLPMQGVVTRDGSGLDEGDRVTCRLQAAALDHEGPSSPLASWLAVMGQSGTLRSRLRGTPAEGNVRAKDGTLDNARALTGFVRTTSGHTLTFAVNLTGVSPTSFDLTNRIVLALTQYAANLPLASISPQAA